MDWNVRRIQQLNGRLPATVTGHEPAIEAYLFLNKRRSILAPGGPVLQPSGQRLIGTDQCQIRNRREISSFDPGLDILWNAKAGPEQYNRAARLSDILAH